MKITQLKEVNWKQKDDILDVAIHVEGNAYKALIEKRGGRVLEVGLHEKSLAKLIESSAKSSDQPVRLLSCSNLASAEKLSKYLDRPVIATDAIVRVHPDGGITTIARSGNSSQQWYKLEGGKRVEVSKPKEPEAKHKGNFVQMGKVSLDPKVEAELSRLRIDKAEFLKDYPSIKNAVDANPALVEGWAVLHKSGVDEATRISKFEDVKKYLDANPNKSIDDVAKEIKAAGGYGKWIQWQQKLKSYPGEIHTYGQAKFLGKSGNTFTNTQPLKSEYKPGGQLWDSWEKNVDYFTDDIMRRQFELFIDKNGKVVNYKGELIDTKGGQFIPFGGGPAQSIDHAIFVMSKDGRIFFSKYQAVQKFHHSTFLAGNDVAAAGEMIIENGIIKSIDNNSGHYRPLFNMVESNMRKELTSRGLDTYLINFIKKF